MWCSRRAALQLGKNNWSILPECTWLNIKFRTRLFSPRTYRTDPPERLTEKPCGRTPLGKLSANHTIHATYLTIIRASHGLFTRFSGCQMASVNVQKPVDQALSALVCSVGAAETDIKPHLRSGRERRRMTAIDREAVNTEKWLAIRPATTPPHSGPIA